MKLNGPKKASAENEVTAVEAATAAASIKRLLINMVFLLTFERVTDPKETGLRRRLGYYPARRWVLTKINKLAYAHLLII
jgi:hypothetical protein